MIDNRQWRIDNALTTTDTDYAQAFHAPTPTSSPHHRHIEGIIPELIHYGSVVAVDRHGHVVAQVG